MRFKLLLIECTARSSGQGTITPPSSFPGGPTSRLRRRAQELPPGGRPHAASHASGVLPWTIAQPSLRDTVCAHAGSLGSAGDRAQLRALHHSRRAAALHRAELLRRRRLEEAPADQSQARRSDRDCACVAPEWLPWATCGAMREFSPCATWPRRRQLSPFATPQPDVFSGAPTASASASFSRSVRPYPWAVIGCCRSPRPRWRRSLLRSFMAHHRPLLPSGKRPLHCVPHVLLPPTTGTHQPHARPGVPAQQQRAWLALMTHDKMRSLVPLQVACTRLRSERPQQWRASPPPPAPIRSQPPIQSRFVCSPTDPPPRHQDREHPPSHRRCFRGCDPRSWRWEWRRHQRAVRLGSRRLWRRSHPRGAPMPPCVQSRGGTASPDS